MIEAKYRPEAFELGRNFTIERTRAARLPAGQRIKHSLWLKKSNRDQKILEYVASDQALIFVGQCILVCNSDLIICELDTTNFYVLSGADPGVARSFIANPRRFANQWSFAALRAPPLY